MLAERFPQTSTCFSRSPDLHGPTPDAVRAAIRQYFVATFDRYEQLFEVLACDEAYYTKPISLRHPLIFYFGHTATFFINKLLLARLMSQRINPRFESLFAVGVDEMSWDDLNDAHYDWPAVAEVRAYRDQVRAAVLDVIDTAALSLPIDWQNPWWAVIMGIEHERIHLETSSVLMRQHALGFVKPHAAWQPCRDTGTAPANRLLPVAAGEVVLGKAFNDALYGWDNEYGRHRAQVPAFEAAQYLVSNQEYLGFVEAGGYREDRYWSEEGLHWRNYARAEHPTFWLRAAVSNAGASQGGCVCVFGAQQTIDCGGSGCGAVKHAKQAVLQWILIFWRKAESDCLPVVGWAFRQYACGADADRQFVACICIAGLQCNL